MSNRSADESRAAKKRRQWLEKVQAKQERSMTDCCEKCNAYKALHSGRGLCRAGKPKVFMLGVQPGALMPGGKRAMTPVMGTFWPEVGEEEWCREFQREGVALDRDQPHFHLQPNHYVEKV